MRLLFKDFCNFNRIFYPVTSVYGKKTCIPVRYDVCLPHINRSPKWPASMLPLRLGQALCLEAGTSKGPEECAQGQEEVPSRVPEGVPARKEGNHQIQETVQTVLPGRGVPIPFEVCPLGASGPGNLTSQFRFWSLLLIHVESLLSLDQREDVET